MQWYLQKGLLLKSNVDFLYWKSSTNIFFVCTYLYVFFLKVKQACFYLYSVVRKRCRGDSDAVDIAQYVPQINLFSEIIVLLIMLYLKKKNYYSCILFSILVFNSVNFVTVQRSVM